MSAVISDTLRSTHFFLKVSQCGLDTAVTISVRPSLPNECVKAEFESTRSKVAFWVAKHVGYYEESKCTREKALVKPIVRVGLEYEKKESRGHGTI